MEQRTIFHIVAFTLALYFFITNIILGSYVLSAGSWGGGLKFLTNWNLLLNFIIASCALLNERNSKFVSYYLLLPGSMVLNVLVFLLYWVIKLFGGFGAAASGWTMVMCLRIITCILEHRLCYLRKSFFIQKPFKFGKEIIRFLL